MDPFASYMIAAGTGAIVALIAAAAIILRR